MLMSFYTMIQAFQVEVQEDNLKNNFHKMFEKSLKRLKS